MAKRILFVLLFAGLLLTSCEKRLFKFVLDINQTQTYNIDHTGYFEVGRVVSREDMLAAADIPENARITDVKVQSLAVSVKVKEGNQASKIIATATIHDLNTGTEKIFENYPVPLTGLLGVSNPFSPVSLLLDRGVQKLASKIKGYATKNDFFDYELILEGNSDPAGQRIVADINLKIVATVKYEECLEVIGLTSEGDACPGTDGDVVP